MALYFVFDVRSTVQNNVVTQAVPVMNPFGTLPAMPQMSIGRSGPTPSIQYGISNMPVSVAAGRFKMIHLE